MIRYVHTESNWVVFGLSVIIWAVFVGISLIGTYIGG